ncbi:unnamed protein product, partial [Laminaria digitata]
MARSRSPPWGGSKRRRSNTTTIISKEGLLPPSEHGSSCGNARRPVPLKAHAQAALLLCGIYLAASGTAVAASTFREEILLLGTLPPASSSSSSSSPNVPTGDIVEHYDGSSSSSSSNLQRGSQGVTAVSGGDLAEQPRVSASHPGLVVVTSARGGGRGVTAAALGSVDHRRYPSHV